MIVNFPEQKIGEELVALAINLATNTRNSEVLSEGDQLENLMNRAIKYRDNLLMKVIRNIAYSSNFSTIHDTIAVYSSDLIHIASKQNENPEFIVEALGVLVNLDANI